MASFFVRRNAAKKPFLPPENCAIPPEKGKNVKFVTNHPKKEEKPSQLASIRHESGVLRYHYTERDAVKFPT